MMNKITGTFVSVLFAIFGLLVVLDYYLPYDEKMAEIESILKQDVRRAGRRRSSYSTYMIKIDGESIRTDAETYQKDNGAEEAKVFRTKILRKIIKLETPGFPIHIRQVPFALFPLVPFLFLLPFIALFIKRKGKFFEFLQPCSLILACILLVMSLI